MPELSVRRVGLMDADEPLRPGIRQRPQGDAVRDGEDGGGRPDPERERDDGREREARVPHEHAYGEPEILAGFIQGEERSLVPLRVLRGFDVAERAPRGAPRFLARQPAAPEVVLEKGEVRCDLAGEIVLGASRAQECIELPEESSQRRHGHSGRGLKCHVFTWMSSGVIVP